ncbi:putative F-box/LRR-repeat protein 23 [Typha latifolia]|uniref:putative F-box/LRR-repeat protein 23 n=1 Tax=Typha latifolia TaxID=4733 RepID=UPI003C2EC4FE
MAGAEMSSNPTDPARNWAELPRDVLSLILRKIGAIEILMGAGLVCRAWLQLAKEPQLWRCVDMTHHADLFNTVDMEAMARTAVDRSGGIMEAFWAEYFGSDELLQYIADRTNVLKSLRLISCYHISDEGLAEAAKRFPQLEELEIKFGSFSEEVCETVGQVCPQLKRFKLNTQWCYLSPLSDSDEEMEENEEAIGIANNMHELRHLQLFGNRLTNDGLMAILDNCPHLESLDIRQCFNVTMDATLRKKCARIRNLRLPHDSTDDYEFCADIGGLESFDNDFLSVSSDSDAVYYNEYDYCELIDDAVYYNEFDYSELIDDDDMDLFFPF